MSNQMIGIAGVLAVTFVLLTLLHFFLSLGRRRSNRYVNPEPPRENKSNVKRLEDDSWLLWSPDNDAGSPNSADEPTRPDRTQWDTGRPPQRFPADR
jgi:hypothetical protein